MQVSEARLAASRMEVSEIPVAASGMEVSEARRAANRMNSLKSCGPRTAEGKAIACRNSLKHGLSGEGIVVPDGELEEIERRVGEFEADMRPKTPAGRALIRRLAVLSVRMEATTRHEVAARARNVRHAADDFDEARHDRADALLEALGEDPRRNLRKLKKTPEGVDLMIEAWHDLRADLTRDPKPVWTAAHLEEAANLTGLKIDHARSTRLGALSRGFWGDFAALTDQDGGDLDEEPRRAWSRARLIERIDAEVEALEAHRETLDFETIALDRAEAGELARFDASKEATLARRYDSDAERNFYKALKEFREVEAESAAQAGALTTPTGPSEPVAPMGSSRETPLPVPPEFDQALREARMAQVPPGRGDDGQPLAFIPTRKSPA